MWKDMLRLFPFFFTVSSVFLQICTGYVEQFDTLLDILTVEEMLMYTAELKRPMQESKETKQNAVEELIDVLGLESCRSVRIGSPLARGISGGQAKRVNIGIALITNPRVLLLDEPTSGLDSYTANEVMSIVKSLSNHGITTVATIHSPTPYTFSLFDSILLMLRGRVVYFGANGSQLLNFFHSMCPSLPGLHDGENEAEWIVDLTTQADRQGRADEFADIYEKSDLKVQVRGGFACTNVSCFFLSRFILFLCLYCRLGVRGLVLVASPVPCISCISLLLLTLCLCVCVCVCRTWACFLSFTCLVQYCTVD